MISDDKPLPGARDADKPGTQPVPTTAAEEWGERIETGRQIARGGKTEGCVPGATGEDAADPRSGKDRCDRP
jgi:hypothetical protein